MNIRFKMLSGSEIDTEIKNILDLRFEYEPKIGDRFFAMHLLLGKLEVSEEEFRRLQEARKEELPKVDLKYTFCEATEENLKALIKAGLVWDGSSLEYWKFFMVDSLDEELNAGNYLWENNSNYKQIHLVDGQFRYVADNKSERITVDSKEVKIPENCRCKSVPIVLKDLDENRKEEECQFAKYGFEVPEFECEIKFECAGWIYGTSDDDSLNLNHEFVICWYTETGKAVDVSGANDFSCYDLKPLKKEWWEYEENFPCLCYTEDDDIPQTIQHIVAKDGLSFIGRHPLANECVRFKKVRRLTPEEVEKLIVKER